MKLHYRKIGQGPPLFILHGLFGSSDSWQTLAKRFAAQHTVYSVDQRNHGRSPHSEDFNYALMSDDLRELIADTGETAIRLIGHSMGGKTAIHFAAHHADWVHRLIVVDTGYKGYAPHHRSIVDGLEAIDLSAVQSRQQADEQLAHYVAELPVRQFLLKNLYRTKEHQWGWRINLSALSRHLHRVVEAVEVDRIEVPTLFIRGGKSRYILESDYPAIKDKFPKGAIHTIASASHWVHAEAPDAFFEAATEFLG